MEFFIVAHSFPAPFFSDRSEKYVEAISARAALIDFIDYSYKHPCGLYVAWAYNSADDYHKAVKPLAKWESRAASIGPDAHNPKAGSLVD